MALIKLEHDPTGSNHSLVTHAESGVHGLP